MIRGGMIEGITFRFSYLSTLIGNIIYLIVIYFLWKSIFASSMRDTVNGMNFNETMIYLVIAVAISNFIEVQVVWEMERIFQSGKIILDITKPISFPRYLFFQMMGRRVDYFITIFIPMFIIIFFMTDGFIKIGLNLVFFFISLCIAIVISYFIDFIIGLIVFYTHSTWGINTMKSVIISLCSGALIPLSFFPPKIKNIMDLLPFKAIYDIPINTLISGDLDVFNWVKLFAFQVFWCIILMIIGICFWNKSKKAIVINGG
jgi:ABC-2 type transport system permease protein